MFFNSWHGLLRVVIVGVLAYSALVLMLRISGKRTLSKMNAFDLVVTIALGSTLATVLLSKEIALMEGLAAFAVLIALQWLVSSLSLRSARVRELVKSEPRLLVFRGELLREALRAERVVENEVYAAVRSQGLASLKEVLAVVLETDGSFTVVESGAGEAQSSVLKPVRGFPAGS